MDETTGKPVLCPNAAGYGAGRENEGVWRAGETDGEGAEGVCGGGKKSVNIDERIVNIKKRFDSYSALKDIENTEGCIEEAEKIVKDINLSHHEKAELYYSIATAYADLETFKYEHRLDEEAISLQEKSIYNFRAALDELEFEDLDDIANGLYQQLYTNAGNTYSRFGRFIEAFNLYRKASEKYGIFPMALANEGQLALEYSSLFYDKSLIQVFYHYAYHCLKKSLIYKHYLNVHGAGKHFEDIFNELEKIYPKEFFENKLDFSGYNYGKTKKEQQYKIWVAENRLFLNPLNDISKQAIAATDYLHLPGLVYLNDQYKFEFHYGLFNQIKQEYISARYLFYEGIQIRKSTHIADKDVWLIEIGDSVNSYSDFSIRTSFRILYALFDRIAFFINDYFDLGIDVGKVSFKKIRKNEKMKNICMNNFMMYAVYWLSKDFYQDGEITTKPNSKKIDELRNYMEHRYVASTLFDDKQDNNMIKYVSTVDLYRHTIDLLKTIRELIIYLVLGINIEENQKRKQAHEKGLKLKKINTRIMKDDWK